ncbi:MAG: ATP-dependent Clp protease adaptor ClpS [Bacteroidetes bacterium]|nr:ATP-dependent Clp protease adaptor ClpS [Bacteroidota bacterium]
MGVKEKSLGSPETVSKEENLHNLILFNDEVNSFDYVIDSLIAICGHDFLQAENCALIAHYKGKCVIKNGSMDALKPMKRELDFRDLTVEIN